MTRITKEGKNFNPVVEEEKSPGIFQKIFYLLVIPLLFIIALLLIVAQFTNTNVFEKATELFPNAINESNDEAGSFQQQSKIVELEAEIEEKEAELLNLQSKLDEALAENVNHEAIEKDLRKQIRDLQIAREESKKEIKEIVSTYEMMSPKKAAPIIVEMNDDEALKILSNLKPDALSSILSKMEPEKAAHYTELLSKR